MFMTMQTFHWLWVGALLDSSNHLLGVMMQCIMHSKQLGQISDRHVHCLSCSLQSW